MKNHFRIALGIFIFSLGVAMIMYEYPDQEAWSGWKLFIMAVNSIGIMGIGLFLLDVDYSIK